MAALEELGLPDAPAHFGGADPDRRRLPQVRRHAPARRPLRDTQRRAIAGFFAETMLDLEEVLKGTTQLLSRVTQYAGLAVPPSGSERGHPADRAHRGRVRADVPRHRPAGARGQGDARPPGGPRRRGALTKLDRQLGATFRGRSRRRRARGGAEARRARPGGPSGRCSSRPPTSSAMLQTGRRRAPRADRRRRQPRRRGRALAARDRAPALRGARARVRACWRS